MIKVLIGNLLESKAQTLVNTVNCVGVMGKGIALEFKKRFPEMYQDYVMRCEQKQVKLGEPYLFKSLFTPWILNFPTKDDWRSVSRIEDIVRGLEYLKQHYKEWDITSLAVPPLGCGNGQLEWRIVGPTLYHHLSELDIPIELYAPYNTPHTELQTAFLDKDTTTKSSEKSMPQPEWIKPGWVAIVEILRRVEQERYHWPVGRTRFQKIAYVATQEGIPTGIVHKRGSYGPFSTELKQIEARLLNNGLINEEHKDRMYEITVGSTFENARKAYEYYLVQWEAKIEKVADLFKRINTDEAEIVATVLYAADDLAKTKKEPPQETEVLEEVMRWKQRRRPPIESSDVAYTIRNLAALGWLDVKSSPDLPISEEMLLEV
jgi:O-acetyl-ADP-ribose deacetylase (regulator of RNase III)/uncharacterized protein YwgA